MPSLLDKMYEDSKVGGKWLGKNAMGSEKKKKTKKPKKKGKSKKIPLTRNEKIMYTVMLLLCIPLGVLFFVYYNSGLMQTIIMAKGLFKTERNLGIPTDPDKVPYTKSTTPGAGKDPSNNKSVFDLMDKQNKKVAGVNPPKQTGGKKRFKQKGGNGFNNATNDAKPFLDTTKFGFPYTWYDNDNLLMRGVSDYFTTFWTFMRGGLVKLLDICNESLYKEGYTGHPQDLGGQVFDFAKFTFLLPMISSIMYVGNIGLGTAALAWSSINNQTLLLPFWIVVGILSLVIGVITTIAITGLTVSYLNIFVAIAFVLLTISVCFFWPYGITWLYTMAMILKPTEEKKRLFRNYLKNYELCWILSMISLLGVTISYVWEWHIIPKVAFGGVGGVFILLRAMGLF
tara:strand:+ start:45 stop:1238 length:1194 start_codon:yes stop_codon:yes gene_type:complete